MLALCLALAGFYWIWELRLTDDGVPLDDAWIYFQFARMNAQGHFSEFNSGEIVTGITGPLWMLLLTPLHAVAGDNVGVFLVLVKALGIILLYLSALVIYDMGRLVFHERNAGLAAACLLLLMPKIVWGALSGMEVPLLVLLVLLALDLMVRHREAGWKRDILTPVVIGLAGQTRPEANLLFVIFIAYQALEWWENRRQDASSRSLGRFLRRVVQQTCIFALVLAPNVIYSYAVTGRLLPNTFYAKTRGLDWGASLRFFVVGNAMLWTDPPATVTIEQMLAWPPSAGVALGLVYSGLKAAFMVTLFVYGIRKAPNKRAMMPALAWLAGDFLLYTIFFTRANRHYFVPMLPPIALVSGRGLAGAVAHFSRRGRRVLSSQAAYWLMAVFLAFLAIGAVDWAREYAWNVKNINEQQVAIGRWVAENLPADAVLAINDVGAIKYFSQRRIIDVTGLLTPELIPYTRAGRKMDYLRAVAPDYLIVYDTWFPEAAQWAGFQWVRDFPLDRNTIAGEAMVRVYKVLSFPPP